MKRLALFGLALTMFAPGCSGGDDPDVIDQQLLAEYRMALPSDTQVMAQYPEASQFTAVGDPALYPNGSYEMATSINGSVTGVIALMKEITDTPPTVYNSETREFVWGPFPNPDGFGYGAAYIAEANGDFQYHYALLRGEGNDLATLTPVIWGAATPDPADDDNGVGITLWDFEANYQFEMSNPNPPADLPRGRFAALYGAGPGENGERVALNFAVFRGFHDGTGDPADLDYLYGRVDDGENTLDFLESQTMVNIDENDPARPGIENLNVRMAFLNEGDGRAEAVATEGDFGANQMGTGIECWDASISRTFLQFEGTTDGTVDFTVSEGDATSCGLFDNSLSDLGVPQIDDIDPALYQAMSDLAENGVTE